MLKRILLWSLLGIVLLGGAAFVADRYTPWPRALVIRYFFERDAAATARALERHVPADVVSILDIPYADDDRGARLDVYSPSTAKDGGRLLPAIVWIHGGAFISGDKSHVGNYLKILAGHGFVAVGIGYSIAPGATYPTPVRQANAALGFLVRNARRLNIDATRIVLAGDSAGAQIAAQLANLIADPSYAQTVGIAPAIGRERLRGAILFCGAYDLGLADPGGPFGAFMRTVLWSYSGRPDFARDESFQRVSVARYVTPAFPPAFISAGNGDPLLSHSQSLARALAEQRVKTDTLFFPADRTPPLPHEYQFDLDSDAGRLALERVLSFLKSNTAAP